MKRSPSPLACASLGIGLSISLSGCVNPLTDYEALTARTAADLQTKTERYVRDTNSLDQVRQDEQHALEVRLNREQAAVTAQISSMDLIGDPRQPLVGKLRAASEQYMADRLKTPTPPVTLSALTAPDMGQVVKSLDQLSKQPDQKEQAKALYAYLKEVYGDLKSDQAAKTAEKSISAQGAANRSAPKQPGQ